LRPARDATRTPAKRAFTTSARTLILLN